MLERLRNRPVFKKYGGVYQLYLEKVEDLDHLLELEEGRWMATSCPLYGLRIEPAFLRVMDADGNGRIISDEVCAAVRWLRERLDADSSWTERLPRLRLELIARGHPSGPILLAAARHALVELGQGEGAEISLDQVRAYRQKVFQLPCNGDGVVPPEAIDEPEAAQFSRDLVAALGGAADASGKPGVDEGTLDRFQKEGTAYLQWRDRGEIPEGESATEIMPCGERTPGMWATLNGLRDKVEEFFSQCSLVRFDPVMTERMGLREEERGQFDYTDRQAIRQRLQRAPLAPANVEGRLPLQGESVNELFRSQLEELLHQVVGPVLGEEVEELDEKGWRQLLAVFAAHESWLQSKPATGLESLGAERLRLLLASPHAQTVRGLIAADREMAGEVQLLQDLEKMLLLHQWLFSFVRNYACFPDLFDSGRAIFDMGTLVLEGREFNFCVQVENRSVHANLAKNSGLFLLYAQVSGAQPGDNFEVVAPVTRGETEGLYVGRRGIFITMEGRELDAQIVQVVDNPVSFWNLMKAPLRFVRGLVSRRFEQMSGGLQKEVESSIGKTGTQIESSLQAGVRQPGQTALGAEVPPPSVPAPAPAVPEGGRTAGNARDLMIGIGFLAAGLGTALKFLADTARQLANPATVKILLIIFAVFLIVLSLITALSAWSKLRRRDLGGLLQAAGWALNGRLRLTRFMSRLFTQQTPLPAGAKKRRWYARFQTRRPARTQESRIEEQRLQEKSEGPG